MKNKTALYVSIGVLALVVIGGYFVIKSLQPTASQTPQEELAIGEYLLTLVLTIRC